MNLMITALIMAVLNIGGVCAAIYTLKLEYLQFIVFMLAYYIIIGVLQNVVMHSYKSPHEMTGPEALHFVMSLLGDVGIVMIGNIITLAIVYNRFGFLKMLGFFATGYVSGVISRAM